MVRCGVGERSGVSRGQSHGRWLSSGGREEQREQTSQTGRQSVVQMAIPTWMNTIHPSEDWWRRRQKERLG